MYQLCNFMISKTDEEGDDSNVDDCKPVLAK
jgi:hypothetical protein